MNFTDLIIIIVVMIIIFLIIYDVRLNQFESFAPAKKADRFIVNDYEITNTSSMNMENRDKVDELLETTNPTEKYIRDNVYNEKPLYRGSPFSNEHIDQYRQNFLDFNSVINRSSDVGKDPVDMINEYKLNEGSSMGMKISDIYDEIVPKSRTKN